MNNLGKIGEKNALEYLLRLGFVLREKNWRYGHLEIDLIMEDSRALRFVEVKSLKRKSLFSPFEEVDSSKMNNMIRAARNYVSRHGIKKEVRFDVVSVIFSSPDRPPLIEYLSDAFFPVD